MRINRLDLTRFGCFTDETLDLSAPGTHLVVGHNEAGKTTAMEAIRQLLFGIPLRTPHAFLHDMRDLRIGASIGDEQGEPLEIVRVKKRSDTLRDLDGNTLDEGLLAKLLHDVSKDVYASLFTIGHDEIAAGGEALLDSDGEVGRALFSASRGTTDLTAVLRSLDDRIGKLFKSSASKPELNVAIREYKEATIEARSLSMSASKVIALDSELASAHRDHDQAAVSRKQLAGRKARLEQVRGTRPLLAKRLDYLTVLSKLEAQGPLVSPGVRSRLEEAQNKRKDGESARRVARSAIERLDKKLDELTIDSDLLEQQEAIERLTRESGGYDQNEKDLPGLKAKAGTAERELVQLRLRLPEKSPLDDEGYSGLTVDQEERIVQLAAARPALDNDLRHATDDLEDTKTALQTSDEEFAKLDEPADVGTLVEVAARIRKAGDLEASRSDTVRNLEIVDGQLTSELTTLGLNNADARAVDATAVPTLAVIRQFRADFDGRAQTASGLEEEIEGLESQHSANDDMLAQLLRSEEPLTTDSLSSARAHRDEGWHHIRVVWLGETDDGEGLSAWADDKLPPDAYEAAVEGADDVADRLRREAAAVERRATLEQQLEALTVDLENQKQALDEIRSTRDTADAAWIQLWAPHDITPQSPAEMEAWHDAYKVCARRSEEARGFNGQVTDLDATIARHRSDLVVSLTSAGESPSGDLSLLGLLDLAEQLAAGAASAREEYTAAARSCDEAQALLKKRTRAHERALGALADWQAEWSAAVTVLGLKATTSTGEANSLLDALGEISTKGATLEELKRRISGIEQRSTEFATGVTAVLAALDGDDDLADADPTAAVKMLSRRVKEMQNVATKSKATTDEREDQEEIQAEADLLVTEAEMLVAEMVKTARVGDESQLSEAIARSEEHTDLLDQIAQAEESLRDVAGKPLDQIEAEATKLANVEIEPEIQQLDLDIEVVDEQIRQKGRTVGELANQRSLVDSSGEAADQMATAQQSLASVVDLADEYVQTMLARRLLEEQVNAYRDEHQGPLLQRARELFRDLTLDRYTGLDTDTDDKGNPYLLARTAGEKLLAISALSTGTRDQLYLALRLAALEQFIDRRGPLPLVLDDLFVHFDDNRTKAGLAVLDHLADKAQVLLFTHHGQVADQAADIIDADRLTIHQLG